MGGDHGPAEVVAGVRLALRHQSEQTRLLLVGDKPTLDRLLAKEDLSGDERIEVVHASEVIGMDEKPAQAMRRGKGSSMWNAIEALRENQAHACVSAGNTGALMAVSRYVLKTVEGIDRPAIASVMPNQNDGYTTVLDLGANVDCEPEHLLQFALMGSALVAAVEGKEDPSVGLLNIGEEAIKGSETIKRAGELLRAVASQGHLNFHGNVEGNDIFKGTTDIVVCDGFVGNVLLKTSEGLAAMLGAFIKQEFGRNLATKLAAVVALPVLNHFKARVDHRRYSGGALLGLKGLVFKAHGSSDAFAFEHALARAYDAARNRLLERVHDRILETLQAMPSAVDESNLSPAA